MSTFDMSRQRRKDKPSGRDLEGPVIVLTAIYAVFLMGLIALNIAPL